MRPPAFSVILLICVALGRGFTIDNGLEGSPTVVCGMEGITVVIATEKPFGGNIYTKGYFESEKCRMKGNVSSSKFTFQLPLTGECGVRRKRTVNPRGMTMDTTVVVMFHKLFLTQVDKAFHIRCMYTEADKEVTQRLYVSMLPTTELPSLEGLHESDDPAVPTCNYEVTKPDSDEEPVRFGSIGERVYHKWTCDGENADKYCMTVHSCVVDDGQGLGQQLIDEKGCALDPYLLNNLDYTGSLSAGQNAHVFKFADRPTVFFGCQIKLQLKDQKTGECVRTSDSCEVLDESTPHQEVTVKVPRREGDSDTIEYDFPTPSAPVEDFDDLEATTPTFYAKKKPNGISKLKRARLRTSRDLDGSHGFNIDVSSPSVDVYDIPESPSLSPNSPSSMEITRHLLTETPKQSKICVSRREFFILLLLLVLLFACSSLISIALYARRRQLTPRSSHYPNFLTNILKCDS